MNNKTLVVFIVMLLISVVLPVTGHEKEIIISKRNDFSTDIEKEFEPLSNGVKWMRTYGITGYDHGYSVLQTDDGGYIVAARSYSDGDITDWIIKTDDNGNIIWNETYRERGFARSIKQTNDGGYIILGQVFSRIDGSTKPSLIKIDSNGNMMWNNTFNKKEVSIGGTL